MARDSQGRLVNIRDGDIIIYQDWWWVVLCKFDADGVFKPVWANSDISLRHHNSHDLVTAYNQGNYRIQSLEEATALRLKGKITAQAYHYFLERQNDKERDSTVTPSRL